MCKLFRVVLGHIQINIAPTPDTSLRRKGKSLRKSPIYLLLCNPYINPVPPVSTAGKSGIIRRPGRPPLKKITNGTTESLAAVLGLDTGGDEGKLAIDAINRGVIKKSTGMSPHNQQVVKIFVLIGEYFLI